MTSKQLAKPCQDCPFRRGVEPGTLGGSPPDVFIGQIAGPFVLNCHKAEGYRDLLRDVTVEKARETPLCAGAALFRANLRDNAALSSLCLLPPELMTLPPDHDAAFSSLEEFVAWHLGISTAEAGIWIEKNGGVIGMLFAQFQEYNRKFRTGGQVNG